MFDAYLDIETTGLSPTYDDITVVGIHLCSGTDTKFVQLVGRDVTADNILEVLRRVSVIYTYNGKSFDLPFIHSCLGIDLASLFAHHDLMYDCWRNNLYGGFKAVERQLGIHRRLTEVNGYEAVKLWWRYVDYFDLDALEALLEYNKEDVINLKILKETLLRSPAKTGQREVAKMRRILLIEGDKVTPVDETEFTEEGKLQDYLEEYPTVIPLSEIVEGASDLVCIGREVGAGSGAIDLLFIDKDGLLTIVETKLRKNREARREVIGQIIEYASYVSQWTADDVYRVASQYFSKSDKVPKEHKDSTLDKVIGKIAGGEFSDEDFRYRVGQNLRDGRIRVIIAVDKLIEPLRATVTFLNSYSKFDVLLLQVSDFEESESKRALVPSLFGYAPKLSDTGIETRQWDEKSLFTDAEERCEPSVVAIITELYEFAKQHADSVSWGKGARVGSFTFRKLRYAVPVSIYTVQSNGVMYFSFGEMKGKEVKGDVLESLRTQLNGIVGISISQEAVRMGKFPTVGVEVLAEAENLDRFKDAVSTLCQEIES